MPKKAVNIYRVSDIDRWPYEKVIEVFAMLVTATDQCAYDSQ